jgi:uncharacterized phage-associated protein
MIAIDDVANYILKKLDGSSFPVNPLKLQKILYYVQAWHLAFFREPLFEGRFQAWAHGPVNYKIFGRFRGKYGMYDAISASEVPQDFKEDSIPFRTREHISNVLEAYGQFSAVQLESLTHSELPWLKAREGIPEGESGSNEISEILMRDYYRERVEHKK